jgi:hypothetical protein
MTRKQKKFSEFGDSDMENKLKSFVSSIRGPFLRRKPLDDSGSTDNDKPEELDEQPGRGEGGNRSLKWRPVLPFVPNFRRTQ